MAFTITTQSISQKAPFPTPSLEDVKEFFPYGSMRTYQDIALPLLIGAFDSGYRFIILEAPTGFGKSALAIGLSHYFSSLAKKTYILVSSKYLQNQYLEDFSTVSVKGRNNFLCLQRKNQTCDIAKGVGALRCTHIPFPSADLTKQVVGKSDKRGKLFLDKGIRVCPYWKQKCEALDHAYPIFNYEYFFHETQYVGDFGKRDFMICDEAHSIESKLMRFIGFEINAHDLEMVGAKAPSGDEKVEWFTVLGDWEDAFQRKISNLETKMDTLTAIDLEKLDDLRSKAMKCTFLRGELDTDPELWIPSIEKSFYKGRLSKKIMFKPIDIKKWGGHLLSLGERFLFQSATINPDIFCESLDIQGNVLHIKIPSIFPVENRFFTFRGVGRMSRGSIDHTLPLLIKEVEKIIQENPKEKGVIHTHSYLIQKQLVHSLTDLRILTHTNLSRDEIFLRFKTSSDPLVLVTPSAYEGVDFKDDECRWQILCKVPYPSLGDAQVKRRMEKDQQWYNWLTALRIIQTYGRGMRAVNDYCRTYILDSDFKGFYFRNKKLFPDWFSEAVRFSP